MDKDKARKHHESRTLVQNKRDLSCIESTIDLSVRKVREVLRQEIEILKSVINSKEKTS